LVLSGKWFYFVGRYWFNGFAQQDFEPIEAVVPVTTIMLKPLDGLFHRLSFQSAGSTLGVATSVDQARALQHAEVLRDRGQRHVKGLGEFADGMGPACELE
jgi:hypothetical protein